MKINDFCQNISETIKIKNKNSTYLFLNTSDIYDGKIIKTNYTALKDLPGQAKKTAQKNDILFSEIRPKNKRWAIIDSNASKENLVISTKLLVLRCNQNILNAKYFYYLLTSPFNINKSFK